MKVSKLFNINILNDHKVTKLASNSKEVTIGDVFFAIPGTKTNGSEYIEEAIKNGAKTIVTSEYKNYQNINVIVVDDVRKTLAECCVKYYHNITKNLKIIGITGTNGKTTTTTLIHNYLKYLGIKSILIGTNGVFADKHYKTSNTTLDILTLYKIFAYAKTSKIKYIIMEVSSHAIKQQRIKYIPFIIGGYTNLTQDHLDYHKTMDDYLYTKILFLNNCQETILNKDDKYFKCINQAINNKSFTYGKDASYQVANIIEKNNKTIFDLKINNITHRICTTLRGEYNVYNVLLMISIVDRLKLFKPELKDFLKLSITIPGRMVEFCYHNYTIIVDYAHTPDAMEKILSYLQIKKQNKLIAVFGAGGNRDKSKREQMGIVASKYADEVILTVDNSRTEDKQSIIKMIMQGISIPYTIELDRKEAIKLAISKATDGDIIAILGRGCEEILVEETPILLNDINVVKEIIGK